MAKLNGPLGSKLRGKVGEVVAAKTVGGVTAIRSYQPVVKNPNTLRQRSARGKFADFSKLASVVSQAVAIGYAKAVSSMRMYARNYFMRDGMADSLLYADSEFDLNQLKVSRKAGLNDTPVGCTAVYASGTGVTCKCGSATPTSAESGNSMGVVFVLVEEGMHDCQVVKGTTSAAKADGLVVADARLMPGVTYYVYAFLKEIEATGTEIPSDTYPWKYPSNTGETVNVGTVTVA